MKGATIGWFGGAFLGLLAVAATLFFWPEADRVVNEPSAGRFHATGPFRVHVAIDPEQPRVGINRLTVIVHDTDGLPVADAAVSAIAEMPAMGAMPAMQAPADLKTDGAGRYRGRFKLPMAGPWPLTVTIEAGGEQAVLNFAMKTSRRGLALASATPGPLVAPSDVSPATVPPEPEPGEFTVDARRRQLIGVRTEKAVYAHLTQTIRAAGVIAYDETRLTDISLKFDAWIGKLYADAVGSPVNKGQVLFTVYSPALVSAQDEYLQALRRSGAAGQVLRLAAERKLALWDIGADQIAALERRGHAADYLPIYSPVTGTVIAKTIVAGSAVKGGTRLLRIADLSSVWAEAQVYESELPLVHAGMAAEVVLPDSLGKPLQGKVSFVYPFLEGETRTARVRVKVPNPDGQLRPEQYAEIRLTADLGKRLVIPESAVLYAGDARIVFLDLGEGRLKPRRITTGVRNDERIEVVGGLAAGDVVVSSGNFLIAAESKLKAGIEQW